MVLSDAKNYAGNTKEGGFQLLRAYRALPKKKALIKFLSEEESNNCFKKPKISTCRITRETCTRLMRHCILLLKKKQSGRIDR
jgi:hypothetical protein